MIDVSAAAIGLLAARLALALVFALAGIAKLRDRRGTARMLQDFGVPASAARPLALALPVAELLVAAALIPSATAPVAGVASVLLLGLFTLAILYNLARGRRPECRCFGQTAAAPIGMGTLMRNVFLTALAVLVVASAPGRNDAVALIWLQTHWGLATIAAGVVGFFAVQLVLSLQIVAQQGRILLRLDAIEQGGGFNASHAPVAAQPTANAGLPVGSTAPAFDLPALNGERSTLEGVLESGKRAALFFAHVNCGPCSALLPEIAQWQARLADRAMVVVITEGERDENRRLFAPHRIERVLLQSEREIADAYQAFGTPAAVVVEPDGSIGSGLAMGADAIRALIATLGPVQSNGWASHAVAVGQAAPDFTARDERGETVALAQFRGRDVIILFWNPQCGFCRQAAGELLPLSAETTAEILVASTGRDEELVGGLRGTMIRDDESKIAHMFGASGTPMAVRVDADGRVASPVAAGKDAVIEIFLGG